jgi:hypothetical protein
MAVMKMSALFINWFLNTAEDFWYVKAFVFKWSPLTAADLALV